MEKIEKIPTGTTPSPRSNLRERKQVRNFEFPIHLSEIAALPHLYNIILKFAKNSLPAPGW
jgi:hypothetical protein